MNNRRARAGFSLVELLTSITILIIILGLLGVMIAGASKVWKSSISQLRANEAGRFSYTRLQESLTQATLNTYWDYDDPTNPTDYLRQSELQYISGPATTANFGTIFTAPVSRQVFTHALFFTAPLGISTIPSNLPLNRLLNGCGYFVEYSNGLDNLPSFLGTLVQPHWRFRLREWIQPSDGLKIYSKTSGVPAYTGDDWIVLPSDVPIPPPSSPTVRSIAENVIAFVVSPRTSLLDGGTALTTDYFYNSRTATVTDIRRNQLAPLVNVTLFILDEDSAARLEAQSAPGTPPAAITSAELNLFQLTANYDQDVATLSQRLVQNKIKYRIVSFNVPMRGSKWSAK